MKMYGCLIHISGFIPVVSLLIDLASNIWDLPLGFKDAIIIILATVPVASGISSAILGLQSKKIDVRNERIDSTFNGVLDGLVPIIITIAGFNEIGYRSIFLVGIIMVVLAIISKIIYSLSLKKSKLCQIPFILGVFTYLILCIGLIKQLKLSWNKPHNERGIIVLLIIMIGSVILAMVLVSIEKDSKDSEAVD